MILAAPMQCGEQSASSSPKYIPFYSMLIIIMEVQAEIRVMSCSLCDLMTRTIDLCPITEDICNDHGLPVLALHTHLLLHA